VDLVKGSSGGDLEHEASQLRDRLADAELDLATLDSELMAFQSDYMRQVGFVMAQVHDLEAQIATLVAERSHSAADARAAEAAREQAYRSTAEANAVPPPPGPPPTDDLKKLFRDAAKRLHPDLFGDEAGRAHAEAFMKRLNAAYMAGDAEAMVDLVRQWEASPLGTAPHDDARAAREIAALRLAVAKAEERLREARESQLADLLERVMAAAAAGGDLMAEMRANANHALADARARLADVSSRA
jgi:hypothetical protein